MFSIIDSFDSIQDPVLITPWTLVHGATGILSYSSFFSILKSKSSFEKQLFWLHALYECKDLYLSYFMKKNLNPNLTNSSIQNSLLNSIGDQIVFMIGVYISKKYEISLQSAFIIQIMAFICLASPLFPNTSLVSQGTLEKRGIEKRGWNFNTWYTRG